MSTEDALSAARVALRTVRWDREEVGHFLVDHPVWASGMACALRSFDYLSDQ